MVGWLVQSLLLSAVFGAVFCDSQEVQVVKNLIATSNKAFRDHNLTEIALPDIGWIFEPVQYRNGRLGQFDTLELQSDPKIVSRTNDYGTLYTFNVSTALRNLTVKYNFHVNYPFVGKNGNVTITPLKKSFQVEGRVLVKHDGTCFATLQDAKVVQFGDFKVKFEPDDAPFITHIYQAVLNVVHQQMIPVVNIGIRSEISKTSFREHFNRYVCDEVTRNSTTEAPTTYSPTTDQPEPTPSRRPHHPSTHHPTTSRPDHSSTQHPPTRRPHHHSTRRPHHHSTRRPHHPSTHHPTRRTTEVPEPETTTYQDY